MLIQLKVEVVASRRLPSRFSLSADGNTRGTRVFCRRMLQLVVVSSVANFQRGASFLHPPSPVSSPILFHCFSSIFSFFFASSFSRTTCRSARIPPTSGLIHSYLRYSCRIRKRGPIKVSNRVPLQSLRDNSFLSFF